jgi:DNA-binding MarR family transcriptional regulator
VADQDDETLVEAFFSVAGRLRHLSHATAAPFGVTPAQARALGVLRRHGAVRLSTLSEHLRIAPRSATEVVDALEERALVQRHPDPEDRRATLVRLTADGDRLSTALQAARSAEAETFFAVLDDADRATLRRILTALRQP